MPRDPYEVLDVARGASGSEIRTAYRRLAHKYHPDKHENNPLRELAAERLAEINAAYAVLGDPRRRAAYDRSAGFDMPASRGASRATNEPNPRRSDPAAAGEAAAEKTAAVGGRSLLGSPAFRQLIKTGWTLLVLVTLVRFGAVIARELVALLRLVFESLLFFRLNPLVLVLALVAFLIFYGGFRRGRAGGRRKARARTGARTGE